MPSRQEAKSVPIPGGAGGIMKRFPGRRTAVAIFDLQAPREPIVAPPGDLPVARTGVAALAPYCASQVAIIILTRSMAAE